MTRSSRVEFVLGRHDGTGMKDRDTRLWDANHAGLCMYVCVYVCMYVHEEPRKGAYARSYI